MYIYQHPLVTFYVVYKFPSQFLSTLLSGVCDLSFYRLIAHCEKQWLL